MGHILSLFTYLLTTSVSSRVPGYPSYYPAGTRVINYPDTAALIMFFCVVVSKINNNNRKAKRDTIKYTEKDKSDKRSNTAVNM